MLRQVVVHALVGDMKGRGKKTSSCMSGIESVWLMLFGCTVGDHDGYVQLPPLPLSPFLLPL